MSEVLYRMICYDLQCHVGANTYAAIYRNCDMLKTEFFITLFSVKVCMCIKGSSLMGLKMLLEI